MITQAEQDVAAFGYNALASLAKAIAFRSLALQALKTNERISATVCAYYSLLHLAITLIYFCPQYVDTVLLDKLRAKRGTGEIDPSNIISHKSAIEFVKSCVQYGLNSNFHSQLERAKNLREFVNYGPRLTIDNDTPYFGPCNDRPQDCDSLISSVTDVFPLALEWASLRSPLDGTVLKISISKCSDFFIQPDLFYKQWSSLACIENCLEFIKELEDKLDAS